MNLNLGFCRPRASAQGLLMAMSCSASVGLATIWIVCDDPRNTVLMMPPSCTFSLLFSRRPKERWESCGDGLLGCREMMKCEWVTCGKRGKGRTSSTGSEVGVDKDICKSWTAGSTGSETECKLKKKEIQWAIMVIVCWMHFLFLKIAYQTCL